MQHNLAVHRRLKNGAAILQLIPQLRGIGQIAIVRNRDLPPFAVPRQWLRVAQERGSRRRVSGVSHRRRSRQITQNVPVEDLRHQPHSLVFVKTVLVAGNDAGALLAAMLQGIKAEAKPPQPRWGGRKCRTRRNNVLDNSAFPSASVSY